MLDAAELFPFGEHRTPNTAAASSYAASARIEDHLAVGSFASFDFFSMSRTPHPGSCFEDGTPVVCLSERAHTLDRLQLQAERHGNHRCTCYVTCSMLAL